MANDHRGRNVHAGHRTDSDVPNAISGWTSPDEDGWNMAVIDEDVAWERGNPARKELSGRPPGDPETVYTHGAPPYSRVQGGVKQGDDGRWAARLARHDDYSAFGSVGRAAMKLRWPQDYRTEYRAKTAVSAMLNRRNEGRNEQTGRGPSEPRGDASQRIPLFAKAEIQRLKPGHPY
jgi:hypothetical protein